MRFALAALVSTTMSVLVSACLGDGGSQVQTTPSQPASASTQVPAEWRVVLDAERAWLDRLAPTATPPRPRAALPVPADRFNDVRTLVGLFATADAKLETYTAGLGHESTAYSRALFRTALYAEIRARFRYSFVFAEGLDGLARVNGVDPNEVIATANRQDTLANQYADFGPRYATVSASTGFQQARWGTTTLADALSRVNSTENLPDPDDPQNRDLLGASAAAEYRNRLIAMLRMRVEAP